MVYNLLIVPKVLLIRTLAKTLLEALLTTNIRTFLLINAHNHPKRMFLWVKRHFFRANQPLSKNALASGSGLGIEEQVNE